MNVEDQKQCSIKKIIPSSINIFLLSALYSCIFKKKKIASLVLNFQIQTATCMYPIKMTNYRKKKHQGKKHFVTSPYFHLRLWENSPFSKKNGLFCEFRVSHFCLLTVFHYFQIIWLPRSYSMKELLKKSIQEISFTKAALILANELFEYFC